MSTRLGQFELIAKLGDGTLGEAHLAVLPGPRRKMRELVVVKTVRPAIAADSAYLAELLGRARTIAQIKHPKLVELREVGQADGVNYVVMEYVDGVPLSSLLVAGVAGHALDVYSSARLIADAAASLHAAHELGFVHGEISPDNVMVLFDGTVKIGDLGFAKSKPGYRAPEVLGGAQGDRRSDIFSLGVVFWELLTMKRLFPAATEESVRKRLKKRDVRPPSAHRRDVTPFHDDICLHTLEAKPTERFQTAEEMSKALEALLARPVVERRNVARFMTRMFARRRAERLALIRGDGDFEVDVPMETPMPVILSGKEVAQAQTYSPLPPSLDTEDEARAWAEFEGHDREPRRWPWVMAAATALVMAVAGAGVVVWRNPSRPAPTTPPAAAPVAGAPIGTPELATPPPTPKEKERPAEPEPAAEAEAEAPAADPPAPAARRPLPVATPMPRPGSADALFEEGAALFVTGKVAEAKARFLRAVALDPGHAKSRRGLGLVYQQQGARLAAVREFERYLRLSPGAEDTQAIRERIDRLKRGRVAALEP